MDLMNRIYDEKPSARVELLLQKSRKLEAEATAALAKAEGLDTWISPWDTTPAQDATLDFDSWLSQILQGDMDSTANT